MSYLFSIVCGLMGIGLVIWHLKRRYEFSQLEQRGGADFRAYLRYHSLKVVLFVSSSLLLGVAVSADDLSGKNITSNMMTVVVIFVLLDVFSNRKKKESR